MKDERIWEVHCGHEKQKVLLHKFEGNIKQVRSITISKCKICKDINFKIEIK